MRNGLLILLLALASTITPVTLGDEGEITIQGEILDMACYVAKGAKGAEHAKCAQACVKGGQPMGLLTAEGTVYLLYAHHENADAFEQAKQHAGHQVEVKGLAAKRGGVNGLEVHSVQAK